MWTALYNTGTELNQFSNGKENSFKDIDQTKLVTFQVRVNSKTFEVNLLEGSMVIDGQRISFENFGLQNDFTLIYFRRVRQIIGSGNSTQMTQCLGWKTNIDNFVFKRILKVNEEGNVTLALK